MSLPRQCRVEQVMADLGLDEMQAYRHVQQADHLHRQLRNDPAFLRKHVQRQRDMQRVAP